MLVQSFVGLSPLVSDVLRDVFDYLNIIVPKDLQEQVVHLLVKLDDLVWPSNVVEEDHLLATRLTGVLLVALAGVGTRTHDPLGILLLVRVVV